MVLDNIKFDQWNKHVLPTQPRNSFRIQCVLFNTHSKISLDSQLICQCLEITLGLSLTNEKGKGLKAPSSHNEQNNYCTRASPVLFILSPKCALYWLSMAVSVLLLVTASFGCQEGGRSADITEPLLQCLTPVSQFSQRSSLRSAFFCEQSH